jgi:hypothetical protein
VFGKLGGPQGAHVTGAKLACPSYRDHRR